MNECKFCQGVADFIWLEDNGQWHVCGECIKDGETDAKAEGEDDE